MVVRLNGETLELRRPAGNALHATRLGGATLWTSALPVPPKADLQTTLERRRKLFLGLFVDEQSPYTGEILRKSKCLKKSEKTRVTFHSGTDRDWPACSDAPSVIHAQRAWFPCGNLIWEVTVQQSAPVKSLAIVCNLTQ